MRHVDSAIFYDDDDNDDDDDDDGVVVAAAIDDQWICKRSFKDRWVSAMTR